MPDPPGPPGMLNTVPVARPVAGSLATRMVIFRPSGSAQSSGTSTDAHRMSFGRADDCELTSSPS
ncbi:hypothetical protein GBF35_12495 [Nonomuraea phyllanthi]|uniref:hypothetical protein n=1 Tax=Nonomuraea phyllanthi TaxID=2219224 RepID=UPI0012931E98|nr:hypothetical protein [Nonomuraea phyllanthi]QFY07395.1 hypothetical protein GBF35_12495 [Nonomuraea phyllanthi]